MTMLRCKPVELFEVRVREIGGHDVDENVDPQSGICEDDGVPVTARACKGERYGQMLFDGRENFRHT